MELEPVGDAEFSSRPDLATGISKARAGDADALGRVLDAFRNYLHRIAREELPPELSLAVSPSDLVQETLGDAAAKFENFRGASGLELLGWLREGLLHNLLDARRRMESQRRSPAHIEGAALLPEGEIHLARAVDLGPSPSSLASRNEEVQRVRDAVARLPGEFQTVIELRDFQGLPFEEIGARMNRSADAARKLWARAVKRLSDVIEP